jgi:hypothetical protein
MAIGSTSNPSTPLCKGTILFSYLHDLCTKSCLAEAVIGADRMEAAMDAQLDLAQPQAIGSRQPLPKA